MVDKEINLVEQIGDSESRTILSQEQRITEAQQVDIEEGNCQDGTEKGEGDEGDIVKDVLGVEIGQEVQERDGDSQETVKWISAVQKDISPLKKLQGIVLHQEGEVECAKEDHESIEHDDGGLDVGQ
ncbi:hypothetical protein HAX54_053358 [Datura stramonium]|uniref:Uncharacterized protein n=1 Tax=Datura stramonium TaxID=4076 RepID=A0ABS8T165_DATST|nr:hypothetical protein [Datura stramonium]